MDYNTTLDPGNRWLIIWVDMVYQIKHWYLPSTQFWDNGSYICSLFLFANDKSILHHDNIQKQKLQNLLKISSNNIFSDSHNPDRVIFNFSSYELTDEEKNVFCKDLNFSVKPGWIEYSEF